MVCLVVKTPLTYHQVRPSILDLLYHLSKLLLLVFLKLPELLHSGDVELVLCLWLWWFERTC